MPSRGIPLILSREEAYALIDAWESLNHATSISQDRYDKALEVTDWLRTAIITLNKPTPYTRWERVNHAIRNARLAWKYGLLRWRNKRNIHALYMTNEERIALKTFLILHTTPSELRPLMEKLREEQ